MDENKNVSKELEKVKKDCGHKDGYDVKFKPGTNEVRNICKTCHSPIGYPSSEELKDNGFM